MTTATASPSLAIPKGPPPGRFTAGTLQRRIDRAVAGAATLDANRKRLMYLREELLNVSAAIVAGERFAPLMARACEMPGVIRTHNPGSDAQALVDHLHSKRGELERDIRELSGAVAGAEAGLAAVEDWTAEIAALKDFEKELRGGFLRAIGTTLGILEERAGEPSEGDFPNVYDSLAYVRAQMAAKNTRLPSEADAASFAADENWAATTGDIERWIRQNKIETAIMREVIFTDGTRSHTAVAIYRAIYEEYAGDQRAGGDRWRIHRPSACLLILHEGRRVMNFLCAQGVRIPNDSVFLKAATVHLRPNGAVQQVIQSSAGDE